MASPPSTAGSAAYTPLALRLYDAWVLGLSNTHAWRCPTATVLLPFFAAHLSRNHLDVGAGTGYYPAAALSLVSLSSLSSSSSSSPPPPASSPPSSSSLPYPTMTLPTPTHQDNDTTHNNNNLQKITFLDLNTTPLQTASRLVQTTHPAVRCATIHADVLAPLPADTTLGTFDSISVIFLLHCLAGPVSHKAKALRMLKRHLSPRGVLYGATILGRGPRGVVAGKGGNGRENDDGQGIETPGWFAWALLNVYNWKGIFGNWDDGPDVLTEALEAEFEEVETRIVGRVLLWVARTPRED